MAQVIALCPKNNSNNNSCNLLTCIGAAGKSVLCSAYCSAVRLLTLNVTPLRPLMMMIAAILTLLILRKTLIKVPQSVQEQDPARGEQLPDREVRDDAVGHGRGRPVAEGLAAGGHSTPSGAVVDVAGVKDISNGRAVVLYPRVVQPLTFGFNLTMQSCLH